MKSKKLLFVILFIFILTLILNLGVYATTVPKPSEPYTYPYWLIYEIDYGSGMMEFMVESRYPIKVSLNNGQLDSWRWAGPFFSWRAWNWTITSSSVTDGGGTYNNYNATGSNILYANHDILNISNGTVFFFQNTTSIPEGYEGGSDGEPTPYPDEIPSGWFDTIIDWVTDSVGGLLQGLVSPLQSIATGIIQTGQALFNKLSDILTQLGNLISWFNPFSSNNIFKVMFIPRSGFLQSDVEDIRLVLYSKIPLVEDLKIIFEYFIDSFTDTTPVGPPEFKINLPSKLGGRSVSIIDFSFFVQYRDFILGIIRAMMWYFFLRRMLKKLPHLVY